MSDLMIWTGSTEIKKGLAQAEADQAAREIHAGDVVQLVGGDSPFMAVSHIYTDNESGARMAVCVWFSQGQPRQLTVGVRALIKITPPRPVTIL